MFATVLDRIDLAGAVITADALHAQRAHARYLAGQRGARYLIASSATSRPARPDRRPAMAAGPYRS